MTTVSPPAPRERKALPIRPSGQVAPRVGAPLVQTAPVAEGLDTLPQRAGPASALALAAAGFPGLTIEPAHERGVIERALAEQALDRIGLAYLRADEASGAPPPEQVAALGELARQCEQRRLRGVRAELSGPVSLALQIVDDQERPLAYDPPLREALAQHLALRGIWLYEQLSLTLGGALICLDEPFLEALGTPFCPLDWEEGGAMLARTLAELPAPRGLCVAGAPNWAAVLALPVELVFFDAYEQSAGLIQAASAVAGYLDRGGILGWGIVPTDPLILAQERAETLARRFISSVEYLAAAGAIAVEQVWSAALISTSSGLGHLPPALATQVAASCDEVAAWLRQHYQPEGSGQGAGSEAAPPEDSKQTAV
jgi:hypothetical protein